MQINPSNPVIVQGDGTVLARDATRRVRPSARDFLARFAELEASPDLLHTYRITPLSLWNAASAGMTLDDDRRSRPSVGMSKFDIPEGRAAQQIEDTIGRYGLIQLQRPPQRAPRLDPARLLRHGLRREAGASQTDTGREIMVLADGRRSLEDPHAGMRGIFKQRLLLENWPVADHRRLQAEGDCRCSMRLRDHHPRRPDPFAPRRLPGRSAVDRWYMDGQPAGGHGVVVLPCGAGKTIVALTAMATASSSTSWCVCNNQTAVDQWVRELIDKTTLTENAGRQSTPGESKSHPPGHRRHLPGPHVASLQDQADYEHMHLFRDHNWGLLVYDEVHLLPAPVFGATAELQGCRRLGLTATLVREDGREGDVFSLVGPKRYDLPWQLLEKQGYVAEAQCHEIRVPFSRRRSRALRGRQRDGEVPARLREPRKARGRARTSWSSHADDNVLIIGTYLGQLRQIAERARRPAHHRRDAPARARASSSASSARGEIKQLVVSKVANFAIDLPDANVAIQVSGSFGSRQEEAQRLGRILRPKDDRRPLLHGGHCRLEGAGVRHEASALPHRAGLPLLHRRHRREVSGTAPGAITAPQDTT